jgi:serine/threonine-protein kinase
MSVELPTGQTEIVARVPKPSGGSGRTASGPGRATAGVKRPERPPRLRSWKWRIALGLVVLAVLVAGGLVAADKFGVFLPSHPVPGLVGKTLSAVRDALKGDHFKLVVDPGVKSTDIPTGKIVSQEPVKGTKLKQGDSVTVVPSAGLPGETIPSLKGDNCTTAATALAAVHLKDLCPALLAYTNTVPKGSVINWSYSGASGLDPTQALYGGTVNIAISEGRAPVKVPDFGADTYTGYVGALGALGLTAREVQAYSTTVPATGVVATTPAPGATVFIGSTVTVTVSKGPHYVTVPDVTKDTVAQATAALAAATLTAGTVYGPPTGKVFTTVPLAGTPQVKAGTAVTLYTQ